MILRRLVLILGVTLLSGCAVAAPAADGVRRVEIAFVGGAVSSGPVRHDVPLGSTVELVVRSDVADEVHLHGYDRRSFVTAGASTTVRFVADLPGVFEVELEAQRAPLGQLQVS